MTNSEMTKIFALLMMNYQNAETFKGGIAKLKPTIQWWTTCLADVDFRVAQLAVQRLCQTCEYPPTIADFRKQVLRIEQEMKSEMESLWLEIRSWDKSIGIEAGYSKLPANSKLRRIIDHMGGPKALIFHGKKPNGEPFSLLNILGFEEAYMAVALCHSLPQNERKQLTIG